MPTSTPHQESSTATLPTPCPTQPVADRRVDTDAPVFDWTPVPDATGYRIQVASSEAFEVFHYDEATERGTALPLASILPDDATTVCWRVRAEGADAERSEWSAPARFSVPSADPEAEDGAIRVDAPPMPLQPEATRDTPVDVSAVPFSWEGIPEASGYQLQVATTEDFGDPSVDLTVDQTTAVTLYDLLPPEADTFYWRIRPLFRVAGPGPWSDPVPFSAAPPTKEEDLAPEAADPRADARARGPVEHARTSGTFSLVVSLVAVISFLVTIALVILLG